MNVDLATSRLAWVGRRGPLMVSCTLGVLIALEIVRVSLTLAGVEPAPPASVAPQPRESSDRAPPGIDIGRIVTAHLFGRVVADQAPTAGDAAPTSASLLLAGTLATRDPAQGIAIIVSDSPTMVFKVGEAVGDAVLREIYSDRVMLDRGGRLEMLRLPRPLAQGTVQRGEAKQPHCAGDACRHARAALSIADMLGTEPSLDTVSNDLRGFIVHPGKNHPAFRKSGLHSGDLVTAVNGTPLQNQDRQHSQQVIDAMLAASQATLSIMRQGEAQELAIDISP